jgi:hypothetical protein
MAPRWCCVRWDIRMRGVPHSLARRIDRLAGRAHRWHRYAHHPLCDAYAHELISLGRRARVCRGCSMVAGGAVVGLSIGLLAGTRVHGHTAAMLMASSWLALAGAVAARRYRIRLSKVVTRLAPALLAASALGLTLRMGLAATALVGGAALAGAAGFILHYRRRGPDRTACDVCPERLLAGPCSGFSPIVRRERAFRRLARSWLTRAGV